MLFGKHHGEDARAREFGLKVIQILRDRCDEFKEQYKLNFSCYATPAEGLSGRFAPMDREIFGVIKGVTDKDYYSNSFHVPVGFKISALEKLEIEAPYHQLCNGGHISYVEVDGKPTPKAVERLVKTAFKEFPELDYIGINFSIRYCKKCFKDVIGEVCTCGSREIQGVSRVTGYLSLDERFGAGKSAERADRFKHI